MVKYGILLSQDESELLENAKEVFSNAGVKVTRTDVVNAAVLFFLFREHELYPDSLVELARRVKRPRKKTVKKPSRVYPQS